MTSQTYDQHKAAELWETSAELVRLQPGESLLRVRNSLEEGQVF
jgi:hypothetical protein